MKDDSAVVISPGELNKIVYREWGFFGEKLNRKRTFGRCHNRTNGFADSCERTLVVGCRVSGLYRCRFEQRKSPAPFVFKERRLVCRRRNVLRVEHALDRLICNVVLSV